MDWLIFALGVLLVLAATVDLIWTTLWVNGGGGPVTSGVEKVSWPLLKAVSGNRHGLLGAAGPIILLLSVGTWVLMLWGGWFLIFDSDPSAVISGSTKLPADEISRLYFVGYTLFTLGNGGFQPAGPGWEIATALTAGSGLFAITLAITYLLSVISAAVSARALASQVSTLGETAADTLRTAWNGQDYADLRYPLQTLTQQLAQFGEQHLAYPILQYFHSREAAKSPVLALVRLEQIVAAAEHGVPKDKRPPQLLLNSARSTIDDIVQILPKHFTNKSAGELAPPDLRPLEEELLPVLPQATLASSLEHRSQIRRKLSSLIQAHSWRHEDLSL